MKRLVVVAWLALAPILSFGQNVQIFTEDGLAIRGYDPVAYFVESAPVKGSPEFKYTWQGVDWLFKSRENMELFSKNPDKYAPQFGGYCAYGVSDNHKAPTEPDAFAIVEGKLYLNYNNKVKQLWVKDVKGNIEKGVINWEKIKNDKL